MNQMAISTPFCTSIRNFAGALADRVDVELLTRTTELHIRSAIRGMEEDYVPETQTIAPTQQSAAKADSLDELFRDVDE